MQKSTKALFSATVLAAAVSFGPVMAQNAPAAAQAPTQSQMQPAVATPSDAQLQKFTGAAQKVSGLAETYRPKIESAKDDAAREKIFKEADEKMVKLVNADGLTVDEFNGIGQAVEQNPQLQQRVREIAQSKTPAKAKSGG
ncbi:DUF4168 domain-containing protein [Alcaligenaceae bacterium A4P071]|nr:DUF4168 domain-containing protein [Alcaligenaceae bacterium B3P038]MDQ2150447.1 DUF4168 domain-containing protein [Alcaligenaceae bacterium C4P045]MDQ2186869.1 DUF4168 domain-containing protein [Alcaligenaceae bacterium A4P071]